MSTIRSTQSHFTTRSVLACAIALFAATGAIEGQATMNQGRVAATQQAGATAAVQPAPRPTRNSSQVEDVVTDGFKEGSFYLGPRVTVAGGYGGTAFGIHAEKAITPPRKDMGNGRFGVGASIDMYSYSDAYFGTRWSYRVIPITASANYHFTLQNTRIDPFVGVVLGYSIVSASVDGPLVGDYAASASSLGAGVQLGARYFVKPNLAVQAQTGLGYGALGLGVAWKR